MKYSVRVAPKGNVEATLDGEEISIGEEVGLPGIEGVYKVENRIQNRSMGKGTLYVRKAE